MLQIMSDFSSGNDPFLEKWIYEAMRSVNQQQPELWKWNLGEQARVAEIFVALRASDPFLGRWNIDLEWNREGISGDPKRLSRAPDTNGVPDLVVHDRGRIGMDHNMLVMEFKNKYDRGKHQRDVEKVGQWMQRFGYRLGLVVALGPNGHEFKPRWTWVQWSPDGSLEELPLAYP